MQRGDGAEHLTSRSEDFPRWYQEVVARAELAENGPARGTMVIRPWGYGIWERLQGALDAAIKAAGAKNAYFPLFIPESFVEREADHVEGFSPELAVVTHGGGKELDEPLVVRPTSETIVNSCFARWVQSHRDLPVIVNQWANVVRWELRPRLFLRTTEFLWQEGHTVHATEEEAHEYALRILHDVYRVILEEVVAVPVLAGEKTARERFAGAKRTWTCEGMMGDGKALQLGTSHELGQNFSRAFGIEFSGEDGTLHYGWQTSWGVSTRLVGGLVMVHGDDFGLRLPPALAPVEVVVLVAREGEGVRRAAEALVEDLRATGRRAELDDRTEIGFGRRSVDWELKGVPARLEVGPRDLAEGRAVLVARHRRHKEPVRLEAAVSAAEELLRTAGAELHAEALAAREAATVDVEGVPEAQEAARAGFARLPVAALGDDGEARLGAEGVTVRCLLGEEPDVAVVGRAY